MYIVDNKNKWTKTRKLTNQMINKFNKESAATGRNAWKDLADPNGKFKGIKQELKLHNWKVRKSWKKSRFNPRERVIEMHGNLQGNVLTLKHVDKETAVKEKTFSTNITPETQDLLRDENTKILFGNSELPTNKWDVFSFEGNNYLDFISSVDTIISSIT